jgi:Kef-type K+ transport system membrane component KefB/CBS domain-containing protein
LVLSDQELALLYLGVLLVFAKAAEELFRRARLVPFVGAILVGIVLGPGVVGFVRAIPTVSLFLSLGINFLLFISGAEEIDTNRMREVFGARTLAGVVAQYTTRVVLVSLAAYLLFHSFLQALVVGSIIGMCSAGPLARLLMDTGLTRSDEGTTIFTEVVLIEVAAVIFFAFLYDLAGKALTPLSISLIAAQLAATVAATILFGRYLLPQILEKVESHFRGREPVFAFMVAMVLILGFAGQAVGFNSAIVALFLGVYLRRFFETRPVLSEKLQAFTYGFFEPLFFAGLGLYFVKITPQLVPATLTVYAVGLGASSLIGLLSSKVYHVDPVRNALGVSVKGGVDSALLVTALTATIGVKLISGYEYSSVALGIALIALTAPLLFRLRAPITRVKRPTGETRILRKQLESLSAKEVAHTLPTVAVRIDEPLRQAARRCWDQDARGAIVVDHDNRPVGTLILRDTMSMSEQELDTLRVAEAPLADPVTVTEDEPALRLAAMFRETGVPIIAVVDREGKLTGTILEREILRRILKTIEE